MMAYPNRTHSINEGEGTSQHLAALYTKFLRDNCPPGPRTEEEVRANSVKKGILIGKGCQPSRDLSDSTRYL